MPSSACAISVTVVTQSFRRSFRYRFYPTADQVEHLNRTFGCVRLVYNMALEARVQARRDGRPIPLPDGVTPSTVTVSRDAAGRWFVCLLCQVTIRPMEPTRRAMGLDAGVTALVTTSAGEKVFNPRHERCVRQRLLKAQRALSRKQPGSANHAKARLRLARIHAKVADRRRDFLHKLTTRLVRENQAVVIEDLNVRGMVRNHRLARAITDAAWREMRSMLEYKCSWYGRELVVIDRWFPSSKRCSECGAVQEAMPLGVRTWTCPCGAVHDRDVNAARNILAVGLAER